jgi:hypothetical protein
MKFLLDLETDRSATDIMTVLDRWAYAQGIKLGRISVVGTDSEPKLPAKDVYLLFLYGQENISPKNLIKVMIVDKENFEDVLYMRYRKTRFESLRECRYLAQDTNEESMRRHCEKMNWNIVDILQTNGY